MLPIEMHMHTHCHTHAHPQDHTHVYNCPRPYWQHTSSAWAAQPPHSSCFLLMNWPPERPCLSLGLGNRAIGTPRGVVSLTIFLLFIFLNVLSARYGQVLFRSNDSIAYSSFLQRSREMSGPYSVLLKPIVSAL